MAAVPPTEYWRWLVRGLGGLIGLLENVQNEGPEIPPEYRDQLETYHAQIGRLLDRMKKREPKS